MNLPLQKTILFYDGVCSFCDFMVQFILKFDSNKRFMFCALQSESGEKILQDHGYQQIELDTLVILHDGKIYTESTAVLTTLKILGGIWTLFLVFKIIPTTIRDGAYRMFARNRYRLFGKKETCRIPSKEQREQFID